MKTTLLSGMIFLIVFTQAYSQGFFNNLKKEIKKEEDINHARQHPNEFQRWVSIGFGSQIPPDAVVGGKDLDGKLLYVAHANYIGNWHPGKTRTDWNGANFEYGGKELTAQSYEVLAGNNGLDWSDVINGNLPSNAFVGGQENQNTLYVCRCEYDGSTQIGKTWQGNNSCNIGFGGKGFNIPVYQVLVQSGSGNTTSFNQPVYNNQPGNNNQPVNNNLPVTNNLPNNFSSNSSNQPNMNQGVSQNSSLKVYGNYDFVPGENILFEDNFQDGQEGEFPDKWDLEKGQAVLNKVNGELALFITQGNYAYVTPLVKNKAYLTDPFTVELDYYVQTEQRNGVRVFIECADNSQKGIYFGPAGDVSSDYFIRDFSSPFPDTNAKLFGQWHHAAFIFKNGQIKTYVDQYRVTIMPNTQIVPVSIKVGGIGDINNPMIFKNLKIAAGGSMNMIGRKFTDAKIVTHGIQFDVGRATIRPTSMGTLNMIKEVMIDNPELRFEIGGHTDADGDAASNLKLSQDRADAVRQALIDLGIDGSRLTTKGYGLTKPISDNNSPEGKSSNRRVEFVRI